MKAVILCAGEGIRLRPLTNDKPKVMVEIAGKPLLEHHINLLRHYGIKEVAINLYYQPEVIEEYFGDGSRFGVKIHYHRELSLQGTAGTVRALKDYLDDTFVVLYGDCVCSVNLKKLIDFHKSKRGIASITVHESSHPYDSDIVVVDANQRAKMFKRVKPRENFVNLTSAALYVMEPEIIGRIEGPDPLDFGRDIFPKILSDGTLKIFAYHTEEYMKDMGTLERLEKVKKDICDGKVNLSFSMQKVKK
jgi:NDP-sugar pyrophosphorylase family protein